MPFFKNSIFFFLFFLCLNAQKARAQRPPNDFSGSNSQPTDSLELNTGEEDTANISYFYPENLGRFYSENDSLLGNYFHQFNPARRRSSDYFTLGNLTSAAYPSVWTPQNRVGLDVGLHAYDLYQIKNSDVRFYQQTKPFMDAYYSGNTLSDGLMQFRFARNFANGINFSLESRRVYNFEEQSFPTFARKIGSEPFLWQYDGVPRGRTVAFATGLWLHKKTTMVF
ncbi:MAG: putative porin [Saprospiraceae bacterium]|nr:putative porin [Saprospiraceae bacterium]